MSDEASEAMSLPLPASVSRDCSPGDMTSQFELKLPNLKMPPQFECDFRLLSGRLRSTSTPFIPRTSRSSMCVTPAIPESLEDSANHTMEYSPEDQSNESIFGSVGPYLDAPRRMMTGSEPVTNLPKLSLFPELDSMVTSFHAVSDDCLMSPTVREAPCLHCSRDKSHSDSDLLSNKFNASQSNRSCSDCRRYRTKRRSCPPLVDPYSTSQQQVSQDTGYHSQFSSFDQSASTLEHSLPHTKPSVRPRTNIAPLQIDFSQMLEKFAPKQLDRLIGPKIGCGDMDIISELSSRNLKNPIGLIFSHLNYKDLARVCQVSRSWRAAVDEDRSATKCLADGRVAKDLQAVEKENLCKKRSPGSGRGVTAAGGVLTPVQLTADIVDNGALTPPCDTSQALEVLELSQKYWKQAERLRNEETLRKCPQCTSPAVTAPVQDRARCTRCDLDFCIHCRNSFHGSSPCGVITTPKKQRPQAKLCGKKSRRNLRRL